MNQLRDDLTRIPPQATHWQPPADSEDGEQALAAWLDATKDFEAPPGPSIFEAMEDASKRFADAHETGRDKLLQDVALQCTSPETARIGLEMLA